MTIDQNFEQIFSTPTRKTVRAIVLKLSSLIHSPLKVDRFELLVNQSKIVWCKIYIMHLMIKITAYKAPFHCPTNDLNRLRYSNRALGELVEM